MKARTPFRTTALAGAATAAACLALAGSASASTTCDLVAATNGSDSAAGTVDQPLKTAQQLVDSLQTGQTGCLRDGTYSSDNQIKVSTPNVTLTSYPGERAKLMGRLYVAQEAPETTISDLDLDGVNKTDLPSPTINADDVNLVGNDITNDHTSICVSLGSLDTWGRADRTLVEDNRIHDCGQMPATNYDHGIYVAAADDTVIRGNWIYDNADRGIQLYPDAQGTLITGNVIDGNGTGVIFSGEGDNASSNNVVENNVITNSNVRDNVESYWDNKVGSGNIVRNNCIGGGGYDDGDGGILKGENVGFNASDNMIKVPEFADAAHGDFAIAASNPCAALLQGGPVPTDPAPSGNGPGPVTIETSKTSVQATNTVSVTGEAAGADKVTIVIRHKGKWHRIGTARVSKDGGYSIRVSFNKAGRQTIKAVAGGRHSKHVKLKVQK